MKFTKKEAFESLKSELTKGGKSPRLSDRSINDYVDNLLEIEAENEDLELDAFVEKYKKTLISMNGNVEHDVSSSVTDFKAEWEKTHPTQKKGEDSIQDPDPDSKTSPEMKAVLDRLKALEDENSSMKEKNAVSQKKADLLSKMKEKGIDNDDWSAGMVAQITITPDMDVDAKAGELLDFYNKTSAKIPRQIITPGPTGGEADNRDSAIAAASALAKQKRESQGLK